MGDRVRIGVVGTSWWADSMYLPALTRHPLAEVRAVVGSRMEHTREFAARWGVPAAYASLDEMLAREELDAVTIMAPNIHHYPYTMAALERGLHVLCEKPLGMNAAQARRHDRDRGAAGRRQHVPVHVLVHAAARGYTKELVDSGYIGRPYHLNMRYFADYGRDGSYIWRFDLGEAGAGISGDLGSHWAYISRWLYGEIAAVTAVFGRVVPRAPRPDGAPFEAAEDSAMILLEFENGATGSLHLSSVAYEPSPFGQLHQWELHGSEGTLHVLCDWDRVERVEGVRIQGVEADRTVERPRLAELPIPDRFYEGAAPRLGPRDVQGHVPGARQHGARVRDGHRRGRRGGSVVPRRLGRAAGRGRGRALGA